MRTHDEARADVAKWAVHVPGTVAAHTEIHNYINEREQAEKDNKERLNLLACELDDCRSTKDLYKRKVEDFAKQIDEGLQLERALRKANAIAFARINELEKRRPGKRHDLEAKVLKLDNELKRANADWALDIAERNKALNELASIKAILEFERKGNRIVVEARASDRKQLETVQQALTGRCREVDELRERLDNQAKWIGDYQERNEKLKIENARLNDRLIGESIKAVPCGCRPDLWGPNECPGVPAGQPFVCKQSQNLHDCTTCVCCKSDGTPLKFVNPDDAGKFVAGPSYEITFTRTDNVDQFTMCERPGCFNQCVRGNLNCASHGGRHPFTCDCKDCY